MTFGTMPAVTSRPASPSSHHEPRSVATGGGKRRRSLERWYRWLLLAPALLVLASITAYPLVANGWNSLHNANLLEPDDHAFVGLTNFQRLLGDQEFVPALIRTVGFAAVSVTLELVLGFCIALALNRPLPGRGLMRTAILLPWAVPTVVAAQLWRAMFDPQTGFVNMALGAMHLPGADIAWQANQWTAWTAIIVADGWQSTALVVILLLAGLQGIPEDVYEAARIDGASAMQTFWRITLPLMRSTVAVVVIFRLLSALLIFDVVYVLTGGQPGNTTETLSFINYHAFITENDFGRGGAISIAMVCLAVAVAILMRRLFQRGDA